MTLRVATGFDELGLTKKTPTFTEDIAYIVSYEVQGSFVYVPNERWRYTVTPSFIV